MNRKIITTGTKNSVRSVATDGGQQTDVMVIDPTWGMEPAYNGKVVEQ
ncbi:MAG: hypothetical protein IKQ24_06075 [Verrucomicrobia bacterium]|jgi:hypothetical protein|nr:hypothetical protein [Verrucomicrobiota bacterium]